MEITKCLLVIVQSLGGIVWVIGQGKREIVHREKENSPKLCLMLSKAVLDDQFDGGCYAS